MAVILSAIFGTLGLHFFYLGRPGYGLLDLGLSLGALYFLIQGDIILALTLFGLDLLHSVVMTFRLLTGVEVDGEGKRVIYPGQKLSAVEP